MNPYSQIDKLMKMIKKHNVEERTYTFTDGTSIILRPGQIKKMHFSVIRGNPNKEANHFLDKHHKGIYDDVGLVHWLAAYSTDPNELWGDED